jgi:hypothetical protein
MIRGQPRYGVRVVREGCAVIVMLMAAGGGVVIVCVLGWGLAAAGLRAGDHPGDAAVGAVLGPGPRPVIIATVRNPADVPLVAGLTVRRRLLPGLPRADWLSPGLTVRVPRRTARRKFLAGAQDTVGVVPAGGQAEFRMTAPALLTRTGLTRTGLTRTGLTRIGRRYRLTAVVGQAGGRLRVIGVPVVSGGPAGAGRPAPAARAGDRD